ncbi:MAG: site-specific DNA-methyltransferase [Candidatus Caldarchaeum sp.]
MGLRQSEEWLKGKGLALYSRRLDLNIMSLFDEIPPIEEKFSPEAQVVLYLGDVNDFLPTIPDETIKLIMTSPPYNIGKEYETRLEIEKYLDQQAKVIRELHRVLKPDGSICWQVGNYIEEGEVFPLDIFYYRIFKSLGMYLRNRIIWHFGHGLHASKRFSGRYETILWFTKSDNYTFNLDVVRVPAKYPGKRHYKGPHKGQPSGNPLGKNPSDVWEILTQEWDEAFWNIPNVKSNHPEKTIHPAQYPIELVERCVLALTNEGDWVFDPYAGVGSSLIAAIKRNRKAMGSEKEPKYVEVARQRIQAYFKGVLPIRPIGKPVYVPSGREKVAQVPEEWRRSSQDVGEDRRTGENSR